MQKDFVNDKIIIHLTVWLSLPIFAFADISNGVKAPCSMLIILSLYDFFFFVNFVALPRFEILILLWIWVKHSQVVKCKLTSLPKTSGGNTNFCIVKFVCSFQLILLIAIVVVLTLRLNKFLSVALQ